MNIYSREMRDMACRVMNPMIWEPREGGRLIVRCKKTKRDYTNEPTNTSKRNKFNLKRRKTHG